jgi:hypothetical protein
VTVNGGGTAKTRDDRRPNRYDLTIQRGDMQREGQLRGDMQGTDGVTPMTVRGDTHDRHGVTPMSPELVHEPVLQLVHENTRVSVPSAFDQFWADYPRKAGRPDAARAYNSTLKRATSAGLRRKAIMEGLADWIRYWEADQTAAMFIPHPATWLNQDRFHDTPPAIVPKQSRNMQTLTNPTLTAALEAIDARNNTGEISQ